MSLRVIRSQPKQVSKTRAAWLIGELGYRYRQGQKVARQSWISASKKSIKFYIECNRRYGKSTFGLLWLAEDAIKFPGGSSAFFAPVKEGLKDYIVPIIEQTFGDCPRDLAPELDSTLTLNFPNGSKIVFRGSNMQQHRHRRGNAFRRVYIDEARDVDELNNLLESVVIPSLFSTEGRVIIGSTPADTEDHDLRQIREVAERDGWFFHSDIYDAMRYDPKDFPSERVEQWKRETLDSVAWEREYLAKWVKDPTKIIVPEWDDKYVLTEPIRDQFFPHYQKYVAMDLGVRDKTAAIFGYYDFKRAKLVIESEFCLQDSAVRTDTIAAMIKSVEESLDYQRVHERGVRLEQKDRVHLRVADNNNPLLINDLNSLHGLDFFPTRKDELPAMINLTREMVKDGRILIDKTCHELLGCLRNAIWDKNKRELARSKVYGHFDALMALVYLVRNLDTTSNPIPQHFGKSPYSHAIQMKSFEPSTGAYQLARIFNVQTDAEKSRENFIGGKI
ncbi:MAG: terminase family protein [Patescibacteria group bacterium]|nr:terminase family protein [Patescibacteria group bacterium]